MNKEMMEALEADGEKLRQLTGEDHGPVFLGPQLTCCVCGEPVARIAPPLCAKCDPETKHP